VSSPYSAALRLAAVATHRLLEVLEPVAAAHPAMISNELCQHRAADMHHEDADVE
jgi:hypothetical protein